MNTLKELREWVLADPESRVVCFQIADKYLVEYDRKPEFMVIPKEHAFSKPVVEAFANDSIAYSRWLRKLNQNHLERGSEASKALSETASKVQSRGLNQRRRAIESDALFSAVKSQVVKDNVADKARYTKRLRDFIKKDYAAHLNGLRGKTKNGRITNEEREMVALEYWESIAQRAAAGEFNSI
jgi:hypothetical protein